MQTPSLELIYTAQVNVGPLLDLGPSALGHRYRVDILGGTFEGPRLRGQVLPGGADRQLLRPDGVKELEAVYDMQTDDGAVLSVRNQVLVHDTGNGERYARSVVDIQAPSGPHAWLSQRVLIGTLQSLRPAKDAVVIHVYQVQ